MKIIKYIFFISLLFIYSRHVNSENLYHVTTGIACGTGDYSAFWFTSNNHGVYSLRPNSGFLRGYVGRIADKKKKWDYDYGFDIVGSYNNDYAVKVQQLYGGISFYKLKLEAGSKEYESHFKDQSLTSGGLVWSGNSMPVPQVRISITDFISVPFTNGWINFKGDISYGAFVDNNWLKDNFKYQANYITTDVLYHQKSLFIQSKRDKKFVLTIGLEVAAQFGGKHSKYLNGELINEEKLDVKFRDFIDIFIPTSGNSNSPAGDQAYFYGNHIGAWHIIANYSLPNSIIKAYTEWIFEDGSGIGKLNGWDGLWGVECQLLNNKYISSFLFEYLDTRNQSGPIHWAPGDHSNTFINSASTGADDYYNHYFYNGWAQFGRAMGSPFAKSPAYNKDGYLSFTDNRLQMYHIGLKGNISSDISYIIKSSLLYSYGSYYEPALAIRKQYSGYAEISYKISKVKDLNVGMKLGIDSGDIFGNNKSLQFTLKKSGLF